jgi:PAS domain S-box-containing protein
MNQESHREPYCVEQRFQGIFDHAIEGIFQTTPDGRYVGANPALARIYGYDSPEDLQEHLSDIQHQLYVDHRRRDEFQRLMAEQGRVASFESAVYRKDGSIIWISENAVAVRDEAGCLLHYEGFVVDITARRSAEEALKRAREELEMRVAERTSELEQANASLKQTAAELRAARDDAERATRAKNEFLSRMSHELRTPLNAILGFAQLLDRPDLQTVQRERIGHIYRAGRHLLELINEVLDIARIESGRLELSLEPVRVCEAFQEVISLLRPLASQRNVELICEEEHGEAAFAFADRQRFIQVLLNLVGNAIKYHRERGGTVRLSSLPVPAERLHVLVTDDGPGIAAEKMDRLFVPFDRLGVEARKCKAPAWAWRFPSAYRSDGRLAGAQSARVKALPSGSNCRERKARSRARCTTVHADRRPFAPRKNAHGRCSMWRIISQILNLLEHVLAEHRGVELLSAMQGRWALISPANTGRTSSFSISICRISPGARCSCSSRRSRHARFPVVVMSADATARRSSASARAGAADYLTKPLDLTRFFQVLNQHLAAPGAEPAHV